MDKKALKIFGKVALGAAKVMVPGVAQAEESIREAASGEAKQRSVLDLVTRNLVDEGHLSNPAIVMDPEFQDGLRLMNDGAVKLMRAIGRHET